MNWKAFFGMIAFALCCVTIIAGIVSLMKFLASLIGEGYMMMCFFGTWILLMATFAGFIHSKDTKNEKESI